MLLMPGPMKNSHKLSSTLKNTPPVAKTDGKRLRKLWTPKDPSNKFKKKSLNWLRINKPLPRIVRGKNSKPSRSQNWRKLSWPIRQDRSKSKRKSPRSPSPLKLKIRNNNPLRALNNLQPPPNLPMDGLRSNWSLSKRVWNLCLQTLAPKWDGRELHKVSKVKTKNNVSINSSCSHKSLRDAGDNNFHNN